MTTGVGTGTPQRALAGATTPTAAGGISFVLAVVLGMISLRASNPWLLLIACSLLTPVVISRLLRPDLSSISICFRSPDRAVVGGVSEHLFHVHNRGRRSSPVLELGHSAVGFAAVRLAVPALPPGGRADLIILRPAVTRGLCLVHDLRLCTGAPFGMALHQRSFSAAGRISVHPAPGPVAVLPELSQGGGGGRPNRLGDEPHELREWRRGDSLRQVHWRATARHDRLTVVIPENTVRSRLALVLLGTPGDDLEALISAAAWSAVQAVRSNAVLRLSAAGRPDYVGDDPGEVLDWFAALDIAPASDLSILAAAQAWAGGTGAVVLATTRPASVTGLGPGIFVLASDGTVSAA